MEQIQINTGRFFRPSPLIQGLDHSIISQQLNILYNCADHIYNSSFIIHNLLSEQELEELLLKALRKIWNNKGFTGEINEQLVKYFADEYWKAVGDGMGSDFETIDENFIEQLQKNVWHFSAAKNYQQLRSLSNALLNPDGSLRSFSQFKVEAMQINQDHVGPWLHAEYQFAVAAGQMGARWQTIQKNKADLPLLKYVTVGDDRVRPAHRLLEGVIRPVDDTFWSIYYPPNGWLCRCDAQQMFGEKVTPLDKIITPENMPAMFKTNFAKYGLVFPPLHPYYEGLPDSIKDKAEQLRIKYYGK